ncbi:Histidinol-phosphate aminotransferase [hydrothermal vent metagenome]|uniref:Histidinol-phosphate aminotransferase n=1 Tax=hydrothermal vent metagenome TaxID=652676 RepID=A0A3B1DY20_9ZZZZ
MTGYVSGEQPQETGWVKLNTNENPYPPSPHVAEAVQKVVSSCRVNVYPDALATPFRNAIGKQFNIDPDWVLPANGSDENLTILMRTFVDEGESIASPYPSYILYETLAKLQNATFERLQLDANWSFQSDRDQQIIDRCKLLFLPNPNSPSGTLWKEEEFLPLVPPCGLLILDGAYADFCDEPIGFEVLHSQKGKQIVITRTLSKSYSLAGIRFGYAVAHPDLIAGMRKVKDSYNCDLLSMTAAVAAIEDHEWMVTNSNKIRKTRSSLTTALRELGFHVLDSQANFVWITHATKQHQHIYEQLKTKKILVRYMVYPHAEMTSPEPLEGLRITVGTDEQITQLLDALREII